MLLPAWVSIATVCFEPRGQIAIPIIDHVPDSHHALSSNPSQYQYQEGDFGIGWSLLHRKFHQSLHITLAAAFDEGE